MNKRPHYLFIFILCLSMIGMALFFQLVVLLPPCPLCVFQRIALIFIGLVALVAFLHNSKGMADRIYGGLLILGAMGSVGVAVRHIYLLSIPKEEAGSCGSAMENILDKFMSFLPQGSVTETLFRSAAECTEISWTLFGFGLPQLVFPVIILLALYIVWLFFQKEKRMFY